MAEMIELHNYLQKWVQRSQLLNCPVELTLEHLLKMLGLSRGRISEYSKDPAGHHIPGYIHQHLIFIDCLSDAEFLHEVKTAENLSDYTREMFNADIEQWKKSQMTLELGAKTASR